MSFPLYVCVFCLNFSFPHFLISINPEKIFSRHSCREAKIKTFKGHESIHAHDHTRWSSLSELRWQQQQDLFLWGSEVAKEEKKKEEEKEEEKEKEQEQKGKGEGEKKGEKTEGEGREKGAETKV